MSDLQNYTWLVSADGNSTLQLASKLLSEFDVVVATSRLRKQYTPQQTHLLCEQVRLRERARKKFPDADQMFFTDIGLQQASSEALARYKADRFPRDVEVFDLCCGIGGDLFSLGRRGPTVGVERESVAAILAEANCHALGLEQASIRTQDVVAMPIAEMPLIHIDPDRRPQGKRTTSASLHEPNEEFLEHLMKHCLGGAIKLAPATNVPSRWSEKCELEWISHHGECKQLVAWFGDLALQSGRRSATGLASGGSSHSFFGELDIVSNTLATKIGRYIYEPDPAVIAARLVEGLAAEHDLHPLAAGVAYLTGDALVESALLATFEVIDQTSMDIKRVKAMLNSHDIGRLEVKKRGVDIDPQQMRSRLKCRGSEAGTLILSRHAGQVVAILTRRSDREQAGTPRP